MRTIKFRGKSLITNEWKYGNLTIKTERYNFVKSTLTTAFVDGIQVNPQTVGQFTGLYDKNGKEIYEGDIVNLAGGYIGKVKWDNDFCGWVQECINPVQFSLHGKTICMFNGGEYEVIGNIHDNPELL